MLKNIKKVAFTATLLILNTIVAYSANCDSYDQTSGEWADCLLGGSFESYAGQYNPDGTLHSIDNKNMGYCSDSSDTTCIETQPATLSNNTYYFKNTSGTDYYKSTFVIGVGFTNTQAHSPTTPVPLSPLSKLILALLFMGASLFMLNRHQARV